MTVAATAPSYRSTSAPKARSSPARARAINSASFEFRHGLSCVPDSCLPQGMDNVGGGVIPWKKRELPWLDSDPFRSPVRRLALRSAAG